MADFYNLLQRDSDNWRNCKQALTDKGIDMTDAPTDDFADKIRAIAIAVSDGFEQTPELRQFPDIRTGLPDSTFKMIVLRNGSGAIGISVTLPSGQSGSINWGDGNTTLTASGTLVTYTHTWTSWLTSNDGLSQYNIVTISGNITALRAATGGSYSRYWQSVVWIAGKCSALTDFQFVLASGGSSLYPYGLRRFELDAPGCLLQRSCFSYSYNLKYFAYNGGYAATYSGDNSYLFYGSAIDEISFSNSASLILSSSFSAGRNQKITVSASTAAAVNASNMCDSNFTLRNITLNFAWGNFYRAFYNCFMLEAIDLSGCPVNGITDAAGWTGLWNCTKILFPSTGTGSSRVPKAFATGIISMGNIDITGSGLSRSALVDMFYSIPANAATRNLTVTGSVGAAELTTGEIAIATTKNWVVIR